MMHGEVEAGNRIAMSVSEAAKALGVSKGLLRMEIARGLLPSRRVGRRIVILVKDLNTYLLSRRG